MTKFKWRLRLWWVRMRVGLLKKRLVAIQRKIAGRERLFIEHQMDLPLHG